METLSPEVLEDLRNGRATRERKIAVCTGGAHLAPADRAEILAVLAHDADEMVASRAQDAMRLGPHRRGGVAKQSANLLVRARDLEPADGV